MILTIHILIAFSSIGLASYLLVKPSGRTLRASYAAIGMTLASGVALVAMESAYLVHACVSGLVYTAAVSVLTARVHAKLAHVKA